MIQTDRFWRNTDLFVPVFRPAAYFLLCTTEHLTWYMMPIWKCAQMLLVFATANVLLTASQSVSCWKVGFKRLICWWFLKWNCLDIYFFLGTRVLCTQLSTVWMYEGHHKGFLIRPICHWHPSSPPHPKIYLMPHYSKPRDWTGAVKMCEGRLNNNIYIFF